MTMHFTPTDGTRQGSISALQGILAELEPPFSQGSTVGIKLHWGEKGNHSFLEPVYAREIAGWLIAQGMKPFIFDTSVLYSGGRRTGKDSLETAAGHGFTEDYLGCPIIIADGSTYDVLSTEGTSPTTFSRIMTPP